MKTAIKMFLGFRSIETERSKFWPIFSNKVHYQNTYVNNSICSPIFIFFNKKKSDFENQNCAIFDLPFQIDPNT